MNACFCRCWISLLKVSSVIGVAQKARCEINRVMISLLSGSFCAIVSYKRVSTRVSTLLVFCLN